MTLGFMRWSTGGIINTIYICAYVYVYGHGHGMGMGVHTILTH